MKLIARPTSIDHFVIRASRRFSYPTKNIFPAWIPIIYGEVDEPVFLENLIPRKGEPWSEEKVEKPPLAALDSRVFTAIRGRCDRYEEVLPWNEQGGRWRA